MKKRLFVVAALIFFFVGSYSTTAYADSNSYNITIDGNFEDWQDKPKTTITSPGDDYNIKEGSLLADSEYIYFMIDMSPVKGNGYNTMQPAGYKLTIGEKVYWLTINGTFNTNDNSVIGQRKEVSVFAWAEDNSVNTTLANAQAMTYRKQTELSYNDMLECRIPLADLNSSNGGSQTITLSNTNLGSQTMTVTGGSTGPILLAAAGFGLAAFGIWRFSKGKKARRVQ